FVMMDQSRDMTTPLFGAPQPTKRRSNDSSFQFGEYQVLCLLARGGTGGVYLASHRKTYNRVAFKALDPHWGQHSDIVDRLIDEHAIAASVDHPNLLQIHAAERTPDNVPYLVMELLDGENLGDLVDRGRVLIGAIAAIGAQIANAVAALHDAGVI